MIRLFNTLTKRKDEFVPLSPGRAGMYNCGPTVYDYVHIGNLRAYVFADTLRRALERSGLSVTQIMNITDVGHLTSDADSGEDKMTKGLKREGLPVTIEGMKTLALRYEDAFKADIAALNIETPERFPRATEHIDEQIDIIKKLEEKGLAYVTSDGVYFSTKDYPGYGKLGGVTDAGDAHGRIEENSEKRDPHDFALWKLNEAMGWESPWGRGFPGWHVECSAMSMKYLGETFDIHTGGIDHISVHHNNEIAQSEGATGKPFANYWLHGAFLTISDEKISKSLGNSVYLKDLVERGVSPLAYRYWLLTAHYRSPIDFSWDALDAAQAAYDRLRVRIAELPEDGTVSESHKARFDDALYDDLGTPQALAVVWEILKDGSLSDADKKATILSFDDALGLKLGETPSVEIPDDIRELVEKREAARASKDWASSDSIRQQIRDLGFDVEDTSAGPRVSKR